LLWVGATVFTICLEAHLYLGFMLQFSPVCLEAQLYPVDAPVFASSPRVPVFLEAQLDLGRRPSFSVCPEA
jgi:hypothetical protein